MAFLSRPKDQKARKSEMTKKNEKEASIEVQGSSHLDIDSVS